MSPGDIYFSFFVLQKFNDIIIINDYRITKYFTNLTIL